MVFFVVVSVLIAVAVVGSCALASAKGCTYCICFFIYVAPRTGDWGGGNPRVECKSDMSGFACVCMRHLKQPWEFLGYCYTVNPSVELELIWPPDLSSFPPSRSLSKMIALVSTGWLHRSTWGKKLAPCSMQTHAGSLMPEVTAVIPTGCTRRTTWISFCCNIP